MLITVTITIKYARDQYLSPKIIELKNLEEEKDSLRGKRDLRSKDRLLRIEEEMRPLRQFLNEAQRQRDRIKAEISMCEYLCSFSRLLNSITER